MTIAGGDPPDPPPAGGAGGSITAAAAERRLPSSAPRAGYGVSARAGAVSQSRTSLAPAGEPAGDGLGPGAAGPVAVLLPVVLADRDDRAAGAQVAE